MRSMMDLLGRATGGRGSKMFLFKTFPSFTSPEKPLPASGHMLTVPWERVGFPPVCLDRWRVMDRRARIIALNDQLRTTFKGGRVQMTPSVYELEDRSARPCPCRCWRDTSKFDADSEHDWGTFIFAGYSFEWRIEYRGKDGSGRSPDPANAEQTLRVLTLYAIDDVLAHAS